MAVFESKLKELRENGLAQLYPQHPRITVGMATCGRAAGADSLFKAFAHDIEQNSLPISLAAVGCAGICWAEPLVEIQFPGYARAVYGNVSLRQVSYILENLANGSIPEEGLLGWIEADEFPMLAERHMLHLGLTPKLADHPFLHKQVRHISASWGHIQPSSIAEFATTGGYKALEHALGHCKPQDIIDCVTASNLRGRGGAGFSTGEKWQIVHDVPSTEKYVIANADEGDPGAYMDRNLMESDPHRILEGLALAGFAVGAAEGFIFTRSEYPLAITTLEQAIAEAEKNGILGENVMGTGWSFTIRLIRSAKAYICGEETAMIQAMQGFRCFPRRRPPYPANKGLWDAPTCVNNIETLANVPFIVLRGAEWFSRIGKPGNAGTKVFSLVGSVKRMGLVEIPLGTSIETLIEEIGGQPMDTVRGIQIGGPSGGIFPPDLSQMPIDYESLGLLGGIMGSGGIVILGHRQCVIDTVLYFLDFSIEESCGQCKSCREGLTDCRDILKRFSAGSAQACDLEELERLCEYVSHNSLCGLGKAAVRPVQTSLRYFHDEYEAHLQGRCPGKVCKDLIHFDVIAANCPGCRCCLPTCPTNAMRGRFGKPFYIEQRLCDKCWMCTYTCPYDAVMVCDK